MYWEIGCGITVDDACVVRANGKKVELNADQNRFLQELISKSYAGDDTYLTRKEIAQILLVLDKDTGYRHDIDSNRLSAAISRVTDALGLVGPGARETLLANNGAGGQNFGYRLREVRRNLERERLGYYESLWKKHCKGKHEQLQDSQRELIEYYTLPSFSYSDGVTLTTPPFSIGGSFIVTAGAGFGKSTLLEMLLLTSIVPVLIEKQSDAISEESKGKEKEYESFNSGFVGDNKKGLFPVFINSREFNEVDLESFSSLLELADSQEVTGFSDLVEEAYRDGNLLLLVDSVDEVDGNRLSVFFRHIRGLRKKYTNTGSTLILASRFLRMEPVFDGNNPSINLYIKELSDDSIEKITKVIRPDDAGSFIVRIKENEYLQSLARNPFMLMVILSLDNGYRRGINDILKSATNAIINSRWRRGEFQVNADYIQLMLGYLACEYVFTGTKSLESEDVREVFMRLKITYESNRVKTVPARFDFSEDGISEFIDLLSSQSGILNVINEEHIQKYVFQDSLVMCYLSSVYICIAQCNFSNANSRRDQTGIRKNAVWLDELIRTFIYHGEDYKLNDDALKALAFVVANSTYEFQISVLYFLMFKYVTSICRDEKRIIQCGVQRIFDKVFGNSELTSNTTHNDYYQMVQNLFYEGND